MDYGSENGRKTVAGDFLRSHLANVFINGSWKGLFNPTERPREPLFQEFFQTQNTFDTVYIGSFEDGDTVAFNQMWNYFGANDFSVAANYEIGKTYWNVENVADYVAVYTWLGTQDFPHNNFVFTRERNLGAKWHFSMWDAEASFNHWGQAQNYDAFNASFGFNDLTNASISAEGGYVRRVVRRFAQSPEFRLLVADRIQRHFNNNGAMSMSALTVRYNSLRNQVEGVISAGYGQAFNASIWSNWAMAGSGRSSVFLTQAAAYSMWPSTVAPGFSRFGGTMTPGSSLLLTNPNAGGTIYFTTDGTDPRLPGGTANTNTGAAYTSALAITRPQTVKARVLNAGVWSAVTEADFAPPPPAVVFSEIHYNPPGGSEALEFLELLNISATPANLTGAHFTDGVEFTFGNTTLAPGARIVLISGAAHLAAFQAAHPGVSVHGFYAGELSNSGETITLRDTTEAIICTLTYADAANPLWPVAADGDGASLVLKRPETMVATSLTNPAWWRRSVAYGGEPGMADSVAFTAPSILTDADHDGATSLVEYALGTSDATPNSAPEYSVGTEGEGVMTITASFNGRTDDVVITGEQSTNHVGWSSMELIAEEWDNPPGKVTRTWRTTLPVGASRMLFRLRVVK